MGLDEVESGLVSIDCSASSCSVLKNFVSVLPRRSSQALALHHLAGSDMTTGSLLPQEPLGETATSNSQARCLSSSAGVGVPHARRHVVLATKDSSYSSYFVGSVISSCRRPTVSSSGYPKKSAFCD